MSYVILSSSWIFLSFPAFAIKLSGISASFYGWDNNSHSIHVYEDHLALSWGGLILVSELVVSQIALPMPFAMKQQLSEWFLCFPGVTNRKGRREFALDLSLAGKESASGWCFFSSSLSPCFGGHVQEANCLLGDFCMPPILRCAISVLSCGE